MSPAKSQKIDVVSAYNRYGPFLHIFFAVLSISVTWYVSQTVGSNAQAAQISINSRRIDENSAQIKQLDDKIERQAGTTMTKEVFDVYQKQYAERTDRLEKKIDQLLSEKHR